MPRIKRIGVDPDGKKLRVTQVRSAATRVAKQQGTLRALGLKRIGHSVEVVGRPEILGMIRTVEHLVEVEEVNEEEQAS